MPALTDGQIRNAIKRVGKQQKTETLTDGEGRGVGRLLLVLKPMPSRVTSDWYAQQWRDGKRTKSKIGTYPHISLTDARELFTRDFTGTIHKGGSIKVVGDARPGTVADLFDAYVENLKESGKNSWPQAKKGLNNIADLLGRNRLARDIEPEDVLGVIRPIYDRGKKAMADHVRSYIRSAYSWGMKSEHDYRSASPRRFKLAFNPAAGIPTEPKVRGERWLDEEEWVKLWRFLENPDTGVHPPYCRAVQLLMLTGQRVQEIATLHIDQYVREEKMLDWSKTKNGKPHSIPLPDLAIELLDSITPGPSGHFFPSMMDQNKSVTHSTLYAFVWRARDRNVVPVVSNRDLRRTWKTLAGKAGITKELRDRLQNHTLQDVSSKSYDRYSYLSERQEAMGVWNEFVKNMIKRPPPRLTVVAA